jgi:ATP-binding cassette, subfamily C, bacterial exporter for protease/lipase
MNANQRDLNRETRFHQAPEISVVLQTFRGLFYALGAFSFAINVLMLAPTIYMLQIYDRVLASRNETTLYMLTIIVVGLFLLEAALDLVRSRALIRASATLDLKLGQRVFEASFERHLASPTGNPGQALSDLTNLRHFLTGKGLFAFFDAPWTPIFILVIALLNPWLGWFGLCSALTLFFLAYRNEKATGPTLGEAAKLALTAQNFAANQLRNAEAIHALGMLGNLQLRWQTKQNRFLALQAEANERSANIMGASRFVRLTMQSAILGLGALLVLDNQLSPGGMIAASILLGRALAPVDLAIATWRGFISAREAYDRLSRLLGEYPAHIKKTPLPRPNGFLKAENLVLAAPGSQTPILRGLSFTIGPGTLVAVIGPSAAGKSCLARGLVGVWKPLNGSVRLDNADIANWDQEELGPWIGYLPQDVELFDGTIAENIARFGKPAPEKIISAARKAGVHDMILRMRDGYDTPIGDGGVALSAGQQQRIALARALYDDPVLMVLDEPNANLDEAGDRALVEALRQLKKEGVTTFVMTHRLNLLGEADAVMILAEGTIQIYGPRDEVTKAVLQSSQLSSPPSGANLHKEGKT